MILVNTDYSVASLWRSRIVSDSLAIPLGFESSPAHKISNCCSSLTSSINYLSAIAYCMSTYIYIYIYIYIYTKVISGIRNVDMEKDGESKLGRTENK